MNFSKTNPVPGMFILTLHTHLPWLAHHGAWPVGEEWLYQAWANSYLRTFSTFKKLAKINKRHLVTLSITPVLATQLNDEYCLKNMHSWLANWQLRTEEALNSDLPTATYQNEKAKEAMHIFEIDWSRGLTKVLQELLQNETIELLSGPINHTFQPLLPKNLRVPLLQYGLEYSSRILNTPTTGIWAPECAYKPGMETEYTQLGIDHFMVDGPAFNNHTGLGHPVGKTEVIAFARNLNLSYKVWSPTAGFPGAANYLDFHAIDNSTGLKIFQVTDKKLSSNQKKPYQPEATKEILEEQVNIFIEHIRKTLLVEQKKLGRPGLAIAAFDTELFGHWWHEGPEWLELLFTKLDEAGIKYGTMQDALKQDYVGKAKELSETSWGLGKDWRIWDSEKVETITQKNQHSLQKTISAVSKLNLENSNIPLKIGNLAFIQLALQLSSDWPFMVSHNSSPQYAIDRVNEHEQNLNLLISMIEAKDFGKNNLNTLDKIFNDYFYYGFDYRDLLKSY